MPPSLDYLQVLRNLKTIAWNTFLEIIHDKILYNVVLCSAVMFFFEFLAYFLMVVHPERMMIDFGMSIIWISAMMISVLVASGLLNKEFEKRIVYVVLSRPVSKFEFIFGKFLGLAGVLKLNCLFLCFVYGLTLFYSICIEGQGDFFDLLKVMNSTLFLGLIFILLQSLMIASMCIFFSTFTTNSLSLMLSIGFLLLGFNVSHFRSLANRMQSDLGARFIHIFSYFIPNFESLSLGQHITYGLPFSSMHIVFCFFYGFAIIALFLVLAGFFIRFREF